MKFLLQFDEFLNFNDMSWVCKNANYAQFLSIMNIKGMNAVVQITCRSRYILRMNCE